MTNIKNTDEADVKIPCPLDVLNNEYIINILYVLMRRDMTVNDISKVTKIPVATVYRSIYKLLDSNYIYISGNRHNPNPRGTPKIRHGNKAITFRASFHEFELKFDSTGCKYSIYTHEGFKDIDKKYDQTIPQKTVPLRRMR